MASRCGAAAGGGGAECVAARWHERPVVGRRAARGRPGGLWQRLPGLLQGLCDTGAAIAIVPALGKAVPARAELLLLLPRRVGRGRQVDAVLQPVDLRLACSLGGGDAPFNRRCACMAEVRRHSQTTGHL